MRVANIALALVLLAGCGPFAGILPPPRENVAQLRTIERANRAAARHPVAVVELLDGRTVTVGALHLAPDSTRWTYPEDGARAVLPTTEIHRVEWPSEPRAPTVNGALYAMVGATALYALASLDSDASGFGGLLAMMGGLAGAGLGVATALDGNRTTAYVITPRE